MSGYLTQLAPSPMLWLLEEDNPAVRQMALRGLLDRPEDDPEVVAARSAARQSHPISSILEAQHPAGYWVKPGAGYSPKYRSTVWQLIFLDQMGAGSEDDGVHRACEYLFSHCQTESGGFGCSGSHLETPPPSSLVLHCLNGNLLRALLGFGWLEDPRVQSAIDWQARSITGEGFGRYYQSGTCGPGFACSANDKLPCAWGAIKAMLALARIPSGQRSPQVQRAVEQGAEFLLSRDPATADYPWPQGNQKPNESWFRLGFPSGYVADVLQNLEALCELGYARDVRLQNAVHWLLTRQDSQGRWRNQYAYNGKTWSDIEKQGEPSKWVTLRACRVLRAVYGYPFSRTSR